MKIDRKELLNIKDYQLEKDQFFLLEFIAKDGNSLLYSDLASYVIGKYEDGNTFWIWTKNAISLKQLDFFQRELRELITEKSSITCKKELYDLFFTSFKKNYSEIGFLTCKSLIPLKKRKGKFIQASLSDISFLSKLYQECELEIEKEYVSDKSSISTIKHLIDQNSLYVLKDQDTIVCMAGYTILGDVAKITMVYTPPKYRRLSYCKNLIYHLTEKLFKEKKRVILYTDYHYLPSNRAYQSIGFQNEGILVNFELEVDYEK